MSLDNVAASMVMRARQLERALHDPGPWTIHAGMYMGNARKVTGEDHVTFIAVLPLMGDGPVPAELHCGEDTVAFKLLDPVGGLAEVRWTFEAVEAVIA